MRYLLSVALISCGALAPHAVGDGGPLDDATLDVVSDGGTNCIYPNTCNDAGCLVTLASSLDVTDIALDDGYVYWTGPRGVVGRLPIDGGCPTVLGAGGMGLALHRGTIFTFVMGGGGFFDTSVVAVPVDGGSERELVVPPVWTDAFDIAANDTTVFWTGMDNAWQAPANGGDATALAPAYTQSGAGPIAVDQSAVYWATGETSNGVLQKAPLDGGSIVTLASGLSWVEAVVVNQDTVYWGDGNGAIHHMSVDGATSGLVVVDGGSGGAITRLAVDDSNVYWPTYGGAIMKAPIHGGALTTLATGQGPVAAIAVDATSVYWASRNGTVMKLAPK